MNQADEKDLPLWTAAEVYDAVEVEDTGMWNAYGISIDSRTVNKGDLFIAMKGDRFDGHDYVQKAIENGAVKAIVSSVPEGVGSEHLIVVEDTLHALRQLGLMRRESTKANLVAITGSVGKTGTKEMLACIARDQKKTHYSAKSFNNHVGVPLTLASMPKDAEIGIFEMGMNNAGEIAQLTRQVRPDIAIITTVQKVHLENLGTPDNIAKAKAEIMDGMPRGSSIILNKDNRYFKFLYDIASERGIWPFSFGMDQHADSHAHDVIVTLDGTFIETKILDEVYEVLFSFIGRHHAVNALAVLTAAKLLGLDMHKAIDSIEQWSPGPGRGELEVISFGPKKDPVILLNESYNSSPIALKAALDVLFQTRPMGKGRRIVILGDMAELGSKRAYIHAEQVIPVEDAGTDLVYTCGPLMKNLYENLYDEDKGGHYNSPAELAPHIADIIQPGDVVLVKGSRGGGVEPQMNVIIKAIRALAQNKQAGARTKRGKRA